MGVVLSLSLRPVCLRFHQHRRHQERISQRNSAVQATGTADERVSGRVAATRPGPLGRAHDRHADIVSSQCSLIKFSQEITKPKTPKVHVIYFCGSDLKIFFKNSLRSSFKTDTIILSLAFILTTVCTYAPL